ncbi:hypothetical protein NE237_008966 [Protea cynaroides]|uniref:Aminotransferase-like plant mobile domain-containing protein n=1 Tax=Protea cynaroides TaxID=273540 RepID=A0A9Q0KXR0_9MAGN|nr:hypothetical protein NE237_008966 [Protea cynaroides]
MGCDSTSLFSFLKAVNCRPDLTRKYALIMMAKTENKVTNLGENEVTNLVSRYLSYGETNIVIFSRGLLGDKRIYPLTMVENINTRFPVSTFVRQVEKLSDEQKNAIKKTGFGHLLIMPNQKLSKTLLAELMDRWSCEKKAFVLPPGDIRISLMDVALILGLRVMGDPVVLRNEEPFSHLEREYGAAPGKREISIAAIKKRLKFFKTMVNDNFIRTFLLFTFGVLLFPNANRTVDSRYLSFLEDLDKLMRYAWGAAVHENLHLWLDRRKKQRIEYVGGCLIFIQMWCYAHIDVARPVHHGQNLPFPRSCRWKNSSSYTRQWFTAKFEKLHGNQIIWELNPTPEESQIDVIRELLEMPKETMESPSISKHLSRTAMDNGLRTPMQAFEGQAVNLEKEPIIDLAGEMPEVQKYNVNLPSASGNPSTNDLVVMRFMQEDEFRTKHNLSEKQEENFSTQKKEFEGQSLESKEDTLTDVNGEISEVGLKVTLEVTQASQCPTAAEDTDDVDSLRTKNEMLEKQVSEMGDVIEELRRENRFLRSHLLSFDSFTDRLERIVLGEDLNDQQEYI